MNNIPEKSDVFVSSESIIRDLKIKNLILNEKLSLVKSIINDIGPRQQKEWIQKDYMIPLQDELIEAIQDLFYLEKGYELDAYYRTPPKN
ncbi:hypothetical protein KAH94_05360 [bacterium]|nr:hypothetical protein [bacterium]